MEAEIGYLFIVVTNLPLDTFNIHEGKSLRYFLCFLIHYLIDILAAQLISLPSSQLSERGFNAPPEDCEKTHFSFCLFINIFGSASHEWSIDRGELGGVFVEDLLSICHPE